MKKIVCICIEPEQHAWLKEDETRNLSGMVQRMLRQQMTWNDNGKKEASNNEHK